MTHLTACFRTSAPGTTSTLKERIAALQQRSTSPQSSPPRKVASRIPAPKNALRDKIARFEEKDGASKSRGSIGVGKPSSRTGEQRDVRIKSLSNTPSEDRTPLDQASYIHRHPRSMSDTHEATRDSSCSPTSSQGDIFSEAYEEESQGFSSVLHSPSSSHFREIGSTTPSEPHSDDFGSHSVSTTTPLIVINNNIDPELLALNLNGTETEQDGPKSLPDNKGSVKTVIATVDRDHEVLTKKKDPTVEIPKSTPAVKTDPQISGKDGNSSGTRSPIIERSLSESIVSCADDSANQVFPILDAFPTVPAHIPLSSSSRPISPPQQPLVNSSAPAHTSFNSIHSISSLASSSTASSCSSTVTTSNNNLETLSTAASKTSQELKPQPRPKSTVPFWYDDDSEDGEPGWVSVTVTTRRY